MIQNLINRWSTNEGKNVITFIKDHAEQHDSLFSEQLLDILSKLPGAELLSSAGVIDFRGIYLSNLNFQNHLFKNIDLSFAHLINCTFNKICWQNSSVRYSIIEGCTFQDSDIYLNLGRSKFTNSYVLSTYFRINFGECEFERIEFSNAKLRLGGVYSKFSNVKVDQCEVYSSRANNCQFNSVQITDSSEIIIHAPGCNFENSNFSGVKFRRTNLEKSQFYRCNFQSARVSDSHLHHCTFIECDLRNAKFENVAFSNSSPIKFTNNQETNFTVINT